MPAAAYVKRHQEMEVRIGEASKSEGRKTGLVDRDPEFLVQFPDQGRLRLLVHFNLAARKFPKTAERFSLSALRDQHPAIRVDQSDGGDEHEFHER